MTSIIKWKMIIAGLALAMIVFSTCADVLSKYLTGTPFRGIYDIVEIALAFVVFLGLPEIFRTGKNIKIDIIDGILSLRSSQLLTIFSTICTVIYLLLITGASLMIVWDSYRFNEYKMDTGIPTWIVGVPVVFGLILSILCVIGYAKTKIQKDNEQVEVA